MSAPTKEYGTAQEVADHYGVSAWVIRKRVSEGTLPALRMGPRTLRISWVSAAAAFGEAPRE